MVDWIKGAMVVGCFAIAFGIKIFWPNTPEDNYIEEAAEELIKRESGIDIDFTPSSKEK